MTYPLARTSPCQIKSRAQIDRMPGPERAAALQHPTVGILFPGEMGSTLGRHLLSRGARVVTTLEGRSERSARLSRAAGLEVLESVCEVVTQADVLVSVVTPAAATAVARRVASELSMRHGRTLYVDINSVSPVTLTNVKSILDRPSVDVVDASIHGLASRFIRDGTLYLSGPAAAEVAALFGSPPRTVVLGDELGRASLLKMLIGGVNKGLVALMLELSETALEEGMLDEFWAVCRSAYPGVMDPFERLLPTYPARAGRRSEEMAELEITVSAAGLRPIMATAVRTVLERASQSPRDVEMLSGRISASGPRKSGPTRVS
jgi:3-hydroxyisobutyrate dehydrogenase-like beta-hydroxyacid dehydrogenase